MTAPSIEPVARRLLGEPNRAQSTKTELRFGTKGSLSVDLAKNVWQDFETRDGGGVLDLIIRKRGGTRRDAADWRRSEGLADSRGRVYRDRSEETTEQKQARARLIWSASVQALNTSAQGYLACRGILIQPPPCIRYNARLNAIVALVQTRDGAFSGIQRIYLETDARGTWKRKRLSLGPVHGAAIRLTPAAETIQITESLEDGLALLQMTGRPTWALPGAGNMKNFEPPPEVREVILAPDHDDAGLKNIESAYRSIHGVTVRQLLPPSGMDWCEVLEDHEERLAIQEEPEPVRSWVEEFVSG